MLDHFSQKRYDLLEIKLSSRSFFDGIRRLITIEKFLKNKTSSIEDINDELRRSLTERIYNKIRKIIKSKIRILVNKDEFYAAKYANDAENIMKEAEKVLLRQNWNSYDKARIMMQLRAKTENLLNVIRIKTSKDVY